MENRTTALENLNRHLCSFSQRDRARVLRYTDKDGIEYTINCHMPVITRSGYDRKNAGIIVSETTCDRVYEVIIVAYNTVIGVFAVDCKDGDITINDAMITSRTDITIVHDFARLFESYPIHWLGYNRETGEVLESDFYTAFKWLAKELQQYDIR